MDNISIKLSADISSAQADIRRLSEELKKLEAEKNKFNRSEIDINKTKNQQKPNSGDKFDNLNKPIQQKNNATPKQAQRLQDIKFPTAQRLQDMKFPTAKSIINKREIEDFRYLQILFNKDYDKYISGMISQARTLKSETQKLRNIINSETDENAKNIYKQKLEDLEAQKRMLETSIGDVKKIKNGGQEDNLGETTNSVSTNNSSKEEQEYIGNKSKLILEALVKGVQMAWDYAKQGAEKALNAEEAVYLMSNRIGVYGEDYGKGRKELLSLSKELGYSPEETANLAQEYMSVAGVKDYNKMLQDVKGIQEFSRAYGVNENQYTQAVSKFTQMGIVKEGDQRKFANLIAESIKANGMTGREQEQIQVLQQLADNLNLNRVNVSDNEMLTGMNLYSKLAQSNEFFKGEKGMSIVNQMNDKIVNGNSITDILLGWGTKYQGLEGRWDFELQKAKGISDPENLATIIENIENMTGEKIENNAYGKMAFAEQLGINPLVAEEILSNKDILDGIKSGSYGKEELDKMFQVIDEGSNLISDKVDDYTNSVLGTSKEFDRVKDQAQQELGEKINKSMKSLKDTRNELSPEANIAIDAGVGAAKLAAGTAVAVKGASLVKGAVAGAGAVGAGSAAASAVGAGSATAGAVGAGAAAGAGAVGAGVAAGAGISLGTVAAVAAPVILAALALSMFAMDKRNSSKIDKKSQDIRDKGGEPLLVPKETPWYDPNGLLSGGAYDVVDKKAITERLSKRQENMTYEYPDVLLPKKPEMSFWENISASSDKRKEYKNELSKWQKSVDNLTIDKERYSSAKSIYEDETGEELAYEDYKNNIEYWKTNKNIDQSTGKRIDKIDESLAIGKDYVPYDGMVAELHKGEAVLTRDEAKDWRTNKIDNSSSNSQITETNSNLYKKIQFQEEFENTLSEEQKNLSARFEILDREKSIIDQRNSLNYKNSQQLNDLENKIKQVTNALNLTLRISSLMFSFRTNSNVPSYRTSNVQSNQSVSDYRWNGEYEKEYGEGENMKIRRKSNLTAEQMDEIILAEAKRRGKEDSVLIGHGKDFIEAYEKTGIHPIDLLSQITLESEFGTNRLAKEKGNVFSIGAFDSDPYNKAYTFGGDKTNLFDQISAGIVEGAQWVAKNYLDVGQDTFYKLSNNNGVHEYATDGNYSTSLTGVRNGLMGSVKKLGYEEEAIPIYTTNDNLENVPTRIEPAPLNTDTELNKQINSNEYIPTSINYEQSLSNSNTEQANININVHVDGKIENLNDQNQNKVTNAIVDSFVTNTDETFTNSLSTNIKREER